MDDVEPQLLDFLRLYVRSFCQWDLIRFFNDNPHAAETAENIARYISRNQDTVQGDLAQLQTTGRLESHSAQGTEIYTLSKAAPTRALVNELVAACADRQFRVKAIYHVIHAMR
jgi:hypothetical protein